MTSRGRGAAALALLIGALALGVGGRARAGGASFDPARVYRVATGASPTHGPADAPVTIVAWSDYACEHCYKVQPTLEGLARLYPLQLRWVHRTLPLDDDETLGPEAALAADAQGKFLPMNDRLFALAGRIDRPAVEQIARSLGLDLVRFRADLDGHAHRAALAADAADARALGVRATPMFFINGRPVHGNQPLQVFADVVDEELARAARRPGDYAARVADGQPAADAPDDATNPRRKLDRAAIYRVGLGLPGHQAGPDDALVTLVVWSDFQCAFCARQAPILARLRERYGAELRVVYRHLTAASHRAAALAAEAAVVAATQGKFWAFHDRLFANAGALARADLERLAAAAGVALAPLRAALDDRRYRDAVAAETAAATALGVDGTPTMFINGAPVSGARDAETMERLIDAHLARAREMVAKGIARADLYAVLMSSAQGDDRADPSRIPAPVAARVELRSDARLRAVIAACRLGDAARAAAFAAALTGAGAQIASAVCAGSGVDLAAPPARATGASTD